MQYNVKLVTQWAHDRNLIDGSTLKDQFIKGVEEGGEIFEAILRRDKDLLVDAIGDKLVVLTILCGIEGLDPLSYIKRVDSSRFAVHGSFTEAVKSYQALHAAASFGMIQGELARAIAKGLPISEHVESMVTILNQISTILCVDIGECYRIAYNEIKHRTGRMVDGVFCKDE